MLKRISISFFAVLTAILFLVSSAGIARYEHHCKVNGTSYSWFIPAEHICESDDMATCSTEQKTCCSAPKNKLDFELSETPCCSSDFNFFYLDSDLAIQTIDNKLTVDTPVLAFNTPFQNSSVPRVLPAPS